MASSVASGEYQEIDTQDVGMDDQNPIPQHTSEAGTSTISQQKSNGKDFSWYLPLCKAALGDDWDAARKFFARDKDANISTKISSNGDTVLHAAVETGLSNDFVKKLLDSYTCDRLDSRNAEGDTALHISAMAGNREAAAMLIERNPGLLYILNGKNRLPIHLAAIFCHKELIKDLMSKYERNVRNCPFEGQLGARLLVGVIASQFFDVALDLVRDYPALAGLRCLNNGNSALEMIARMNSVFQSGECFCWWQLFIYARIPLALYTSKISTSDIENHSSDISHTYQTFSWFQVAHGVAQKLNFKIWEAMERLVPQVKKIKDKKLMHRQAMELVKCLCKILECMPHNEASPLYEHSIILATECGIHEIVQVIVKAFPMSVFVTDTETCSNIFLLAARNRYENIFNLIYQMSDRKNQFYDSVDSSRNNFMHLCARLAPPHKLNLVSGAALQMQRELQWFKEMEKFVRPSRRIWRNKDGLTPKMLFTKEHQELKSQGERWMKDTANSCTFAAALIATVVFAAAFTVPGGIEMKTGVAIFWDRCPFVLFAISDTISLFTSVTSLLMFLSILTSRYAEEDFLYALPNRLSIGLLTLFISITFMMIAFGATMYLVFWKKVGMLLVPVAALACLPVTSFVLLQFPLLVDVMYSTYGPGIFGKVGDHPLY